MANEQTQNNQKNQNDGADKKAAGYKVFDTNQRGDVPRMHDVITRMFDDGREPEVLTYKLYYDKPTTMPQEHAFKFLCDPAFKVIGPNGNRIMPIEKFDPSKPLTELKDDEIVVKYAELSRESLFRRVKLIAGSEDIPANASVEELSRFMIDWRTKLRGMTEGDRAIAEKMANFSGNIGDDDLDKMFGERKAA